MANNPYRMPAEWEPQRAVWLAWPHQRNEWTGKYGAIPWVYIEIMRALIAYTPINLLVKNTKEQELVTRILQRAGVASQYITLHVIPTNRIWMRDCAGTFVYNEAGKHLLNWRFNGWAKYANHRLDNAVPHQMGQTLMTPTHLGRHVVMEGGAFDVNGKGVLLTTEECLLHPTQQVRNPAFTREDYEQIFATYLGASQVIWLGHGIAGDDTHGHVDDLARFVNEDTIVVAVEEDPHDPNYNATRYAYNHLKQQKNSAGKAFNVVPLPMPQPVLLDGERLPASYANFLISNGVVLVPTFNDKNDRKALNILADLMPKHDIIGIHATDLVAELGTLHCLSQQEPI